MTNETTMVFRTPPRLMLAGIGVLLLSGAIARAAPAPVGTGQAEPAPSASPSPVPSPAPATASSPASAATLVLRERVMVVGESSTAASIPGAAHYLGGEELAREKTGPDDVHRLLGRVPGVQVQEEEGYGRRPNIGLRGAGSDRSAKITLLEDGVLVAPAAYAAPAAYYFPVTGRMDGIEVRKGSSQIKHGPNTIGGALNLVSTGIPDPLTLRARGELGSDDLRKAHVNLGDTWGRFGWLLETYQSATDGFKRLDGGGPTGFDLQDYLGKLRYATSSGSGAYQQLELKLGYTREDADETYLGLTETDFRADARRRYAGSQRDQLRARHEQYQLRHFLAVPGGLDVTTTLYRNEFSRNWYKLDSVLRRGIADVLDAPELYPSELDVLRGGDSPSDALVVRANARDYFAEGVETLIGLRRELGAMRHQLELGVRYHRDQEDRFQHDDAYRMNGGLMELTRAGAPGSNANRVGDASAWAWFAQDRVQHGLFALTPGLRLERIDLTRTDWARTDAERVGPTQVVVNRLTTLIPGIGLAFTRDAATTLFAGVHRGFAPPGPGSREETEAESAWNYELGARQERDGRRLELVGFYNDYDNLLGRDTLASGGTGSGDIFNGGAVRLYGIEASLQQDLGRALGLGVGLPLRVSYTLTQASFRSSFASEYEAWGTVEEGDELPYLAEHQLHAGLALRASRLELDLGLRYASRMRTEAGQGPIPPGQGTDVQLVLDATAGVALSRALRVYASALNLTDAADIVARRPAGARPNMPRTLSVGFRLDLHR
ncbi:MAG: TonB-dependent receptor family protein [Vicinamibacteria bacterium]